MKPEDILTHLRATFADLDIISTSDTHFVFDAASRALAPEHRLPFVTIVTSDAHDKASDLGRPGVFRLNIGVSRDTYRARFGPEPAWNREGDGVVDTGHDHTRLDTLMPHPVYSPMGWVCVLNPSEKTWREALPLIDEAHRIASDRHAKAVAARADPAGGGEG